MAEAHADRNLLFGLLAVQMSFVGREALIEAMNASARDRSQPLAAILVDRGALSARRRRLLEELVDEHVRSHDDNPIMSLASVESAGSVRASIAARVDDPQVRASLVAARQVKAAAEQADPDRTVGFRSASNPHHRADDFSRFRILRPHAEGGLGAVFVALDTELGREVALKQIKPAAAARADLRARFVLEAEITGGLEHPGIVPVYSMGYDAAGQPYYAMRFIRGHS